MKRMHRHFITGLLIGTCCLVFALSAGAQAWRKQDLFREAAEGTVVIYAAESWDSFTSEEYRLGSGFFINEDGIVATNSHVIENEELILIKTLSGDIYETIDVIADYPDVDLALLHVDIPEEEVYPLALSVDWVEIGEDVFVIGSPAGMEYTFSNGIVSSIRPDEASGISTIQITAPISPGSSGGPVLNDRAEVVAVVVATLADPEAQNINFGIPVEILLDLLQEYEIDFWVWDMEEDSFEDDDPS